MCNGASGHEGVAPRGRDEARQHVDRRRLAGTVGAQQRQQVPLPHRVPGRLHREKRAASAAELGDEAPYLI